MQRRVAAGFEVEFIAAGREWENSEKAFPVSGVAIDFVGLQITQHYFRAGNGDRSVRSVDGAIECAVVDGLLPGDAEGWTGFAGFPGGAGSRRLLRTGGGGRETWGSKKNEGGDKISYAAGARDSP